MIQSEVIRAFVCAQFGTAASDLEMRPLRGGLEGCGVARVCVFDSRSGRRQPAGSFVVKLLTQAGERELAFHSAVQQASSTHQIAPKLLNSQRTGSGDVYMFMEWINAASRWPWKDTSCAGLVLDQLARVHALDGNPVAAATWNYNTELQISAASTITMYQRIATAGLRRGRRPMARPLERVGSAIHKLREQVMAFTGAFLVHGDAHPGNALIRRHRGELQAVLLDWGRARVGSPLEDLCTWLQSLGFWEPDARRVHDTLLRRYLRARGETGPASRALRDAYWLAGGSNAFAGALRYHLTVMADPHRTARQRWVASCAAEDWLRIIRRAEERWFCGSVRPDGSDRRTS
jgi:aminoglycoside phosphotransferase (APT) family kinase protein